MALLTHSPTAFTFRWEVPSKRLLLISDVHFDSVKCDRQMLTRHLDQALADNASVFIFGDWFDLMQGMYDPRRSYSGLRPEYKSITYLDDVIEDSAAYLSKYASVIEFIGRGNHETNIEKRLSTSPIDRLCQLLGRNVTPGPYSGWIRLLGFRGSKQTRQLLLHFHHGYGGNAPRSKGVLNVDLDQKEWPDADIIVSGHTHQKWHVPMTVERVTTHMTVSEQSVHHLKLGSYKKLDRFAGWEVEKGFAQPRLGGWWCDLHYMRDRSEERERICLWATFTEAT
jgi:UDP-2,3-diacylglucosamine pyrophosphatase LpxH